MKKYLLFLLALALISSCSKEDTKPPMSVKNNELVLFHESTEKLIVENNPGDLSFKSQNELIASVSDEGVVEGGVRGETTILITSLDETTTASIEVKTLINYLPEPYLGFGEDYETVKSKVAAGEEIIKLDDGFAISKRIDNSDVIYAYYFENNKLDISMFVFETLSNISDIIADFLLERYIPVTQTGALSFGLLSPEEDKLILLSTSEDNSLIYVGYTKYEGETNLSVQGTNFFNEKVTNILNDERIYSKIH